MSCESTFDPAELLSSQEAIATFVADALESGDAGYIAHALGIVVRARGMMPMRSEHSPMLDGRP